ncbi:amino acid permease [Polymorphospora sp. NPDC051019]|uniref:APC family permease n=1 Tax=Polymorphospora sp. NPDC051019 TaxID=3155725 RepID=UPI0034326BD6
MTQSALARKTIGTLGLTGAGVSASSPVTVVAGGIVATYASTGVAGLPLAVVLLGGALLLLTVGYLALAARTGQAATFYGVLADGLGRAAGVSGAFVAVVAYYAIQISLYGLFGAVVAASVGGLWWVWATIGWAAVAVAGIRQITAGTRIIATVLACQLLILILLVATAVTNPAGGQLTVTGFDPSALLVDGWGGVLALSIAAFIGIESPTTYAEEARTGRAVTTAVRAGVIAAGIGYALCAWAVGVAVGPDQVGDPAAMSGQPWQILAARYGPVLPAVAGLILAAGIVTAMIALHGVAARYIFALGRDRVLPAILGATTAAGAPVGGSLAQTFVAAAVIAGTAWIGADPMLLFAWLSSLAAVAIVALLTATSLAAIVVGLRERRTSHGVWTYGIGPALGAVAGACLLAVMVGNLHLLVGIAPQSPLRHVVPACVIAAAAAGLVWAAVLRDRRPAVYAAIGAGRPDPLTVPDRRLASLEL